MRCWTQLINFSTVTASMNIAIVISHDKYFWHKSIADILTLRPVWNLINLVETWPGKTHMITAPYITDNCWNYWFYKHHSSFWHQLRLSEDLITKSSRLGRTHKTTAHFNFIYISSWLRDTNWTDIQWQSGEECPGWTLGTGVYNWTTSDFNWETTWGCTGAVSDLD